VRATAPKRQVCGRDSNGNSSQTLGDSIRERVRNIKSCPTFADVSEAALHDVASSAVVRHFRRGEYIIQEGDLPAFLPLIPEGRVKIFKQSASGKNVTLGMHCPVQTVDGSATFEGRAHSVSAQFLDDVTIMRLRRDDYTVQA